MEDGVKTGTKPKRQAFPEGFAAYHIAMQEQKHGIWLTDNSFICKDLREFLRRRFPVRILEEVVHPSGVEPETC
jgi:hypothetical protein